MGYGLSVYTDSFGDLFSATGHQTLNILIIFSKNSFHLGEHLPQLPATVQHQLYEYSYVPHGFLHSCDGFVCQRWTYFYQSYSGFCDLARYCVPTIHRASFPSFRLAPPLPSALPVYIKIFITLEKSLFVSY